ncbi:MAG: cytochrome c [Methylomonas sp.]|nr:cytochrome c [Methylomonas sp.]
MKNFLVLISACCAMTACSSRPAGSDAFSGDSSGSPALHAVQDRELRQLMDRMNGLMMERFMTEHEMDIERSRYTRQIVEASKTLTVTATSLVNKLPGLGLSENEQAAFRSLAQTLGQHANDLQNQAKNHNFNAMSSTLHEMRATCQACHTLFRKL